MSDYTLNNLGKINVILGKNGSGKSLLLRKISRGLMNDNTKYGTIKYITPERGGILIYEAGLEQNFTNNRNYIRDIRTGNLSNNFRQQSIVQLKEL